MFNPILQKFSEKSPITVMVQALLERLLNAEKIETWFDEVSEVQYTKKILFSSLVALMLEVVCRVRKNVYSAYLNSTIDATRQAVYEKLQKVELNTSQELVRYIGSESEQIIREMEKTPHAPVVEGYRVKFLDGNCIEASEKRLKPLRRTGAGALPGKTLVVFDQEWGIVSDVFPCEDGHAQERSLLPQVLETVQAGELWCADRNFCVLSFLFGLEQKGAHFVIRQHASTPFIPLTEKVFVGESDTGTVYEQRVQLGLEGQTLEVRRILVDLHTATRNGDTQLCLFTNLPATIDALRACEKIS